MMKQYLIITSLILFLISCNSLQDNTTNLYPIESEIIESSGQLDKIQNFIQNTGFNEEFVFAENPKTWQDLYAFYKKWKNKASDVLGFKQLEQRILLATFNKAETSVCPSCIFKYDGSDLSKQVLKEYKNAFENTSFKSPQIAYYLLKELEKVEDKLIIKKYTKYWVNQMAEWEKNKTKELKEITQKDKSTLRRKHFIQIQLEYISLLKAW